MPKKQHVAYLSPTQTAHYAREKTTEKIEIMYLMGHRPESLKISREDTLETTIESRSPVKRFPVEDNVNKLLESELSWRSDHALKPANRYIPE